MKNLKQTTLSVLIFVLVNLFLFTSCVQDVNKDDVQKLTKNWKTQNSLIKHPNQKETQNIVWEFPLKDMEDLLNNMKPNTQYIRFYIGSKTSNPAQIADYVLLAVPVSVEDNAEKDDLGLVYQSNGGELMNLNIDFNVLPSKAKKPFEKDLANQYLQNYRNFNGGKKMLVNDNNEEIKAFRFSIEDLKAIVQFKPKQFLLTIGIKNEKRIDKNGTIKQTSTLIMIAKGIDNNNSNKSGEDGLIFDYTDICPPACSSPPSLG